MLLLIGQSYFHEMCDFGEVQNVTQQAGKTEQFEQCRAGEAERGLVPRDHGAVSCRGMLKSPRTQVKTLCFTFRSRSIVLGQLR